MKKEKYKYMIMDDWWTEQILIWHHSSMFYFRNLLPLPNRPCSIPAALYKQGMGKVSCSIFSWLNIEMSSRENLHSKPLSKTQVYWWPFQSHVSPVLVQQLHANYWLYSWQGRLQHSKPAKQNRIDLESCIPVGPYIKFSAITFSFFSSFNENSWKVLQKR